MSQTARSREFVTAKNHTALENTPISGAMLVKHPNHTLTRAQDRNPPARHASVHASEAAVQ